MNHTERLLVDVAALTDPGRVRERNEDSFAVFRLGRFLERVTSSLPAEDLPERHEAIGHVMIVADGLGGHEAGEVASHTAISKVLEAVLSEQHWALELDDPATREKELEELAQRSREYLADAMSAQFTRVTDRFARTPA